MDSKGCAFCGKTFTKNPNYSYAQWESAHYCSRACQKNSMKSRKTITCKMCGISIETHAKSTRQFCSRSCFAKWLRQHPCPVPAQLHAPESRAKAFKALRKYWDEHKRVAVCEMCSAKFRPRIPAARFCSRKCRSVWWSQHRLETVICPGCGASFTRSSTRGRLKKYCSQTCFLSHVAGPENPNWKGGPEFYYGPEWPRVARFIRRRDKVCQECGKSPKENRRALDVHHIIPFREFPSYLEANYPENLKALCSQCHWKYRKREY